MKNISIYITKLIKKSIERLLISAPSPLKCILHFIFFSSKYKISAISAIIKSVKPMSISSLISLAIISYCSSK